jgi:hypothetical protein
MYKTMIPVFFNNFFAVMLLSRIDFFYLFQSEPVVPGFQRLL